MVQWLGVHWWYPFSRRALGLGRVVLAAALSLDERALILAPGDLGVRACAPLASAGIGWLCTDDALQLAPWLSEGVGLVIVAEQALPQDPDWPLQQFIDLQPRWSDLPVLLMTSTPWSGDLSQWARLGNLSLLPAPFEDAQLLLLASQALRARRRQYQARDQFEALLQQLPDTPPPPTEQAVNQARKMEAIGQLAGGVAHDFNNLLTSIGGSFELIERRLQQGRTQELDSVLRMGKEAVTRGARLTHQLLAFSSRQSLHSEPLDLHALLQPQRWAAKLGSAIELHIDAPADLWHVQADDQQLQQALDNLLSNACDAMPSGGRLDLLASNERVDGRQFAEGDLTSGDYLRLSVIDSGQGMPQAILEHAFEPFFSTKPVGQSIGLGLSMVYGFCKQSQGHVTLSSQIGHGTRVDLYLPRSPDTHPPAPTASRAPGSGDGNRREVLVVEDDPDVRALLCQALDDDGLPCHSAANANDALQILRSPQPLALLVSDIGMPGMNGRQLAEIARKLRPGLQVLFITGYAEAAMSRDGFLDPGMQLITKPFELRQLRQCIARMLGET